MDGFTGYVSTTGENKSERNKHDVNEKQLVQQIEEIEKVLHSKRESIKFEVQIK